MLGHYVAKCSPEIWKIMVVFDVLCFQLFQADDKVRVCCRPKEVIEKELSRLLHLHYGPDNVQMASH